jgi:hypothetical protein
MKMEQTQCSETSDIKHLTPENNPKDYTRHSEYSESSKSRRTLHDLFRELKFMFWKLRGSTANFQILNALCSGTRLITADIRSFASRK